MTQPCLYCNQPATIGPCQPQDGCCNHDVICMSCQKGSVLSVNLELVGKCDVRKEVDLPLFREEPAA